jgi:hypothetical protein
VPESESAQHPALAKSSTGAVDEIERGLRPQEGLKNSGLQASQDYKTNGISALVFKPIFGKKPDFDGF